MKEFIDKGYLELPIHEIISFFNTKDASDLARKIEINTFHALTCYESLNKEGLRFYGPAVGIYFNNSDPADEEFAGFRDMFINCFRNKGYSHEEIKTILSNYHKN